eukprot:gnl/Dysnectes_brevis/2406_a2856_856.p2 GENE.gnl/Dysnectes_brevis/2406_a2856_856~~gnl/Dysnectes_brevis/2406_a2856_856.p2  ORF type:complete len:219 (+),score=31.95 gnl/Dysnectes_brevis/2406_a2856_856:75-731(+)
MSNPKPWEVLKVAPNVSQAVLKSVYRKLVLKHHPDKTKSNPDSILRFKEIQRAYEVMKSPEYQQQLVTQREERTKRTERDVEAKQHRSDLRKRLLVQEMQAREEEYGRRRQALTEDDLYDAPGASTSVRVRWTPLHPQTVESLTQIFGMVSAVSRVEMRGSRRAVVHFDSPLGSSLSCSLSGMCGLRVKPRDGLPGHVSLAHVMAREEEILQGMEELT